MPRGCWWKSFWFGGHQRTTAPCLTVLVLMGNDESTGGCEKAPPAFGCCGRLFCGFLLAQEWKFAVWLLGTVGQCSQSSVCSLACRAPRVSLAPEGRQTKRHHCLTHWSCSPTHSLFLLNGGTFLFLGEEWQKETSFLETGPQDNKTAVVLSYVFFSQFKCHFELLLVVICFFLFALCFSSPFV